MRATKEKDDTIVRLRALLRHNGSAGGSGPEVIEPGAVDLRENGVFVLREDSEELGTGKMILLTKKIMFNRYYS